MSRDALEVVVYPELEAQSSRITLSRTADEEQTSDANECCTQGGTQATSMHPKQNAKRRDAQQEKDKFALHKPNMPAPVSTSTYKPRYTPLFVVPDEEAQRREQQRRREEDVLERVKKRRLQLLRDLESSNTSDSSRNGHDIKGVWQFVGIGVVMGFMLSFLSFALMCCHEGVGLRGGRINAFVLGVYVGMFVGFAAISISVVRFVDVSRFCNPVNEISATSAL